MAYQRISNRRSQEEHAEDLRKYAEEHQGDLSNLYSNNPVLYKWFRSLRERHENNERSKKNATALMAAINLPLTLLTQRKYAEREPTLWLPPDTPPDATPDYGLELDPTFEYLTRLVCEKHPQFSRLAAEDTVRNYLAIPNRRGRLTLEPTDDFDPRCYKPAISSPTREEPKKLPSPTPPDR
ncbi:MAG: hypothetical protein WAZ18_00020 [Alphaproteobacteria bacterium]